jgi:hypothetical protein
MSLSFTIAACWPSPTQSFSYLKPHGNHDHILLSQIRDSPNLVGQVPIFLSHRNTMARLYPQTMGSLFVASYDSQGYGGVCRTPLYTAGLESSLYSLGVDLSENPAFISSSTVAMGALPGDNSDIVDRFSGSSQATHVPSHDRCIATDIQATLF